MSIAKDGGTGARGVMAETAASVNYNSEKLEPGVVKMIVGLVIATGVIGTLFWLS